MLLSSKVAEPPTHIDSRTTTIIPCLKASRVFFQIIEGKDILLTRDKLYDMYLAMLEFTKKELNNTLVQSLNFLYF